MNTKNLFVIETLDVPRVSETTLAKTVTGKSILIAMLNAYLVSKIILPTVKVVIHIKSY